MTTDEAPMIESPMIDSPMIESPMIEAPMFEAPMIEAPMSEAPMIEEPMSEAPVDPYHLYSTRYLAYCSFQKGLFFLDFFLKTFVLVTVYIYKDIW